MRSINTDEFESLKQQRDELLNALKFYTNHYSRPNKAQQLIESIEK